MLSSFIRKHMEEILEDWENFAGTLRPAALELDSQALRNTAEDILNAVADDMETAQSPAEQRQKSRGELPGSGPEVTRTARNHAGDRLVEMFTLNQLVAEYRALRASVVRHWREAGEGTDQQSRELTRFNEAIDQSLSEAIHYYDGRLSEARDLFIGVLAHDLRTPLQAMLMSAETLLLDDGVASDSREAAQRIRNSGRRVERMLDDLLDLARARFGQSLPLAPEAADLCRIVAGVLDEVNATTAGVPVHLDLPEALPGVWDAGRLAQVVSNLLRNALEHGDGRPVTVRGGLDGGVVKLSVHNWGAVIPPEQQRLIFNPFIRAAAEDGAAHGSGQGLGLGLYIAQHILAEHGGTLDVHSTPEQGTTFTVALPPQP